MPRLPQSTAAFPRMEEAAANLQSLFSTGAIPQPDPSALAIAALLQALAPHLSARTVWRRLGDSLAHLRRRHAEQVRLRSHLGLELPLSAEECARMHEEVRRFQWIEAERAGRNIWAERDASDPEAAALIEWFRRHFGAWYLSQRRVRRAS